MSEWQPIETAPRDGTDILLWGDGRVALGRWDENEWRDHGDIGCGGLVDYEATHWMLLPEPPK